MQMYYIRLDLPDQLKQPYGSPAVPPAVHSKYTAQQSGNIYIHLVVEEIYIFFFSSSPTISHIGLMTLCQKFLINACDNSRCTPLVIMAVNL